MSDDRKTEEGFFAGGGPTDRPASAGGQEPGPPPPRQRESPLLARSPAFAIVVVLVAGWLLSTLWPDLAYFASPRAPIDLGGPGSYRLAAARENRLVQVRGELAPTVSVAEGRSGATRTVGRLAGTNLLVDRPGRGGPPVFEGRLLPRSALDGYGEVARLLGERGGPLPAGWRVLRDGEHPRQQWPAVVGAALLAAVIALNLRAVLRPFFPAHRERR
jgi:hypothetical protein